jgi:DNA-binding response OmpR family regulator
LKKIKITLTEDDEDDQFFFSQALTDSGIEAELTNVTDGIQLIDHLLNFSKAPVTDVVFLDLNMPGLDGKSCLKEIRRHENLSSIPIIILSTSSRAKDITDAYEYGANKYIVKMQFYAGSVPCLTKLFAGDWRQRLSRPSMETFCQID